ncbi:MAG: hypothetical protein ACI9DC_001351 [Gammaproteobacteria bacterium]|jgi:hypothetical protein
MGRCAAEHDLANVGDKVRVDGPVGLVDPGDMNRPSWVSNEEIFHGRANIHQNRPRIRVQKLVCLDGRQSVRLWFTHRYPSPAWFAFTNAFLSLCGYAARPMMIAIGGLPSALFINDLSHRVLSLDAFIE